VRAHPCSFSASFAAAKLQPAFAVHLRAPGELRYRPLALAVLRIERRSNEDEVNPKEVR